MKEKKLEIFTILMTTVLPLINFMFLLFGLLFLRNSFDMVDTTVRILCFGSPIVLLSGMIILIFLRNNTTYSCVVIQLITLLSAYLFYSVYFLHLF